MSLIFQAILTVAKEVKSIIKIQATIRGYLGKHKIYLLQFIYSNIELNLVLIENYLCENKTSFFTKNVSTLLFIYFIYFTYSFNHLLSFFFF